MRISGTKARLTARMQLQNGQMVFSQDHLKGEVLVTALIPVQMWLKIHENAWHYKELIYLGVQAKQGMPQINERITELERGNHKLQETLSKMWQANHKQEGK